MSFMDKIKETANSVKEKATNFAEEQQLNDKLSSVTESVKKSFGESTESFKDYTREGKELKKPLEGAIIRYEVIYKGGLPEYPKAKSGAIGMNIMEDRFSFIKTNGSKDWFENFDILYSTITDLHIEKRMISTGEMLLGGGDDPNQQQENNICITFETEDGRELMLRVEMLTGVTIYGQAGKCREFMDILRQNSILKKFKGESTNTAQAAKSTDTPDILSQIEKLSALKDAGILTEEEFTEKKTLLLSRL